LKSARSFSFANKLALGGASSTSSLHKLLVGLGLGTACMLYSISDMNITRNLDVDEISIKVPNFPAEVLFLFLGYND